MKHACRTNPNWKTRFSAGHAFLPIAAIARRRPQAYEVLAQIRKHMGPELCAERCTVLAEMGDEHVGEAIRILDRERQSTETVLPYQALAVKLENQRGKYSAAASRLQVLIDLPGRDEYWLSQQGDALEMAGRTDKAHDKFQLPLDAIQELPYARRDTHAVQELTGQLNRKLSREEEARP
jgi:hypothetical protein